MTVNQFHIRRWQDKATGAVGTYGTSIPVPLTKTSFNKVGKLRRAYVDIVSAVGAAVNKGSATCQIFCETTSGTALTGTAYLANIGLYQPIEVWAQEPTGTASVKIVYYTEAIGYVTIEYEY